MQSADGSSVCCSHRRYLTMATTRRRRLEGSIDVCSFMSRTYHSRLTHAQKRSNGKLSYQIEFFTWLISLGGRCCRADTRNQFQNIPRFSFNLGMALNSDNTRLINIFQKKIQLSDDDVTVMCHYMSQSFGSSSEKAVFLSSKNTPLFTHSLYSHSVVYSILRSKLRFESSLHCIVGLLAEHVNYFSPFCDGE